MALIIDKTALSRHIAGILHGISSTARVRRKPRIREIAKCDMAEARPARFPLAGRYTLLDHESALERLTVTQRVVNHRAEPRLQGLPAGQESALFNYGKQ